MFYLDLFSALERHRIDYVLVGGLAVSLHGVERATMDIDISVAMAKDNLVAIVALAREMGMTPVAPVALDTLADPETLTRWKREKNLISFALRAPTAAGVTLDVLLFPPIDHAKLAEGALVKQVGRVPVRLASLDDLIALKRAAGRPIDLSDIEHLQRVRGA